METFKHKFEESRGERKDIAHFKEKWNKSIKNIADFLEKELLRLRRRGELNSKSFNKLYYESFVKASKAIRIDNVEELIEKESLSIQKHPMLRDVVLEFENAIERAFQRFAKDTTKDQLPEIIIVSNVETNFNQIFYDFFPKVEKGVQLEGVFGTQVEVRKRKHMKKSLTTEEDFSQFAYMVNHLKHEKRVPILLFIGKNKKLIRERRKRFFEQARKSGYLIEKGKSYYIYVKAGEEMKKVFAPLVIYEVNRKGGIFYAVEEGKKLTDFLKEHKEEIGKEFVNKVVERLEKHEKDENAYKIEVIRRLLQSFSCVDARHNIFFVSQTVKELGGIPKEGEISRMLDHDYTRLIRIELHKGCGYLTAVKKMHDFFESIRNKSEGVKKTVRAQINILLNNKDVHALHLGEEFEEHIDEKHRGVYDMLFRNDKGDYLFILKHMLSLGVMEIKDGLPYSKIAENTQSVDEVVYNAALWVKKRVEKAIKEKGKEGIVEVKVYVRSFKDGGREEV